MDKASPSKSRLLYVDNIRIYLTVLAILHSVAVSYGGALDWSLNDAATAYGHMGFWPLKEAATDPYSPILFLMFTVLNQSYYISILFLIAGYLTPSSLEKKGSASFIKGRLVKLGIPMLFYVVILEPITRWFVANYVYNLDSSMVEILREKFKVSNFLLIDFGHLWFLELLLILAGLYVIYKKRGPRQPIIVYENSFPPNGAIEVFIVVLSIATFITRIWFPVWATVFRPLVAMHFRVGLVYFACFIVGVLAYRGRWFDNITDMQARLWGKVSLVNFCLLPVVFFIGSNSGVDALLGGLTWQSLVVSSWDSVSMTSIFIWLLALFKNKFDLQDKWLRWASSNVYAAFIFHYIVVILLMIPLVRVAWPSTLKFVLVSIISIPVSFIVGSLVRRIPWIGKRF
jgi:glucan biosynthesis protein C